MQSARVSIIVPCYNLGQYLAEAVDSVLAQTFQDFEVVVVDDGSTERETLRVLASFDKPRTRIVRSNNCGLPAAKNLGLAHTTGPYVCMLDADDRLEPTLLEKSVAALDTDPSIAFVSHWLRTFGDEVWEWTPASCDASALLDANTVNGAALVRRSALEAVGGFDESMREGCEDWDIWISLVEQGFKGTILPEVLFNYRRRPESMSRAMMRGDGHPRLYRRLAEKHPRIFRDQVGPLIVRREDDIANLRRHIHDLELERYNWLDPELAKWRSDVAMLDRKAARVARDRARDEQLTALRTAVDRLESERALDAHRFEDERAAEARRFDDERAAEARRFEDERAAEARRFEDERARMQAEAEEKVAQVRAASEADLAQVRATADDERAQMRAAAEDARTKSAAMFERARSETEIVRGERDRYARAFDAARARALELDASYNRARTNADDLRRSLSWRITAPLRAVYRGLRRIAGRNRS
jgi:glycosyltransferase involved in cell wall biosynthesis